MNSGDRGWVGHDRGVEVEKKLNIFSDLVMTID